MKELKITLLHGGYYFIEDREASMSVETDDIEVVMRYLVLKMEG